MASIVCSQCNKLIVGPYMTVRNGKYHHECFCCEHCRLPIKGNFVEYGSEKRPHHALCVEQVVEQEAIRKGNVCKKCKKACCQGKYVTLPDGDVYHEQCFQCIDCEKMITGTFKKYGDEQVPLHSECARVRDIAKAKSEGRICKKCKQACCFDKYVTLPDGDMYHEQCFQCIDCAKQITGSYIKYGDEKVPLHSECARLRDIAKAKSEGRICKKCKRVCFEGKIMTVAEGEIYHAACFTCTYCKKEIGSTYSLYGEGALPYHSDCLAAMRDKSTPRSRNNTTSTTSTSTSTSSTSDKKNTDSAPAAAPRICKKCKLLCDTGTSYTTKTNDVYHANCFRCADPKCNGLLTGTYTEHGDLPYHPACGRELFAPRCTLCTHTLEGTFFRHPFFDSEIYCRSHESLPSCFACSRKQPLPASHREGFVKLPDGRSLCGECAGSIIVDSSEAVAIYKGIVDFMGRELGLKIPPEMRDVPILLVDVQSLNENKSKPNEVLGYHNDAVSATDADPVPPSSAFRPVLPPSPVKIISTQPVVPSAVALKKPSAAATVAAAKVSKVDPVSGNSIIRGLTMSTCSKVRYFPSAGLSLDATSKALTTRPPVPEVYQMKEVRDVSAVLVLYGLPRDLTASILAHEAMHVWLKLNKTFPFRLPPKLEEGLCQVIAHLYLEALVASSIQMKPTDTPQVPILSKGGSAKVSPSSAIPSLVPPAVPPRPSALKRPTSVRLKTNSTPTKAIKTLTRWFSEQIEVDKSPVYGVGFQEANRAVSMMGLKAVLAYIQAHQRLPPLRNS